MTLPWIERSPFVNSVSCVRQPVIYLAVFIWLFVKLEEFIYDTTLLGSVNGLAEYTVSSMHHQTFIQGFSELLEENNQVYWAKPTFYEFILVWVQDLQGTYIIIYQLGKVELHKFTDNACEANRSISSGAIMGPPLCNGTTMAILHTSDT